MLFLSFYTISFLLSTNPPIASPHFGVLDLADSDISSTALTVPSSGWEYMTDNKFEPEDSILYRLSVMTERDNTYGFIVPNTKASPHFYINGSLQNLPNKNTLPESGNTYYFTPRANKTELIIQYLKEDLASLKSDADISELIPEIIIGGENIIGTYTAKSFINSSLFAGFCLFCVFIGLAGYFMIYKNSLYLYSAFGSLCAFFMLLLSTNNLLPSLFIVADEIITYKLSIVAFIAFSGLFAQFSIKLFSSILNYWVVTGYKIYCIICAIVIIFAPFSALNSIIMIFCIVTATIAAYIFIMLLSSRRNLSMTVSILWMTSTALFIAFLLGNLTGQIEDVRLLQCAIITSLGSEVLCVKLSSPYADRISARGSVPSSAFSEAMQIVNRLNYIKSQLIANTSANPTLSGFNEVSANPNMNRRAVGVSAEEELRRDLKNISAEANRLSLLAQRMLNATYSKQIQSFDKVQLSKCAEKAYDLCAPMFEDKNNSFTLETEPWLPFVFGETDMVMQVILHLLTNVNDRTKNGTVMVHVTRGQNRKSVQFDIHDTGDIIEPDELSQIYSSENVPPQNAEIFGLYVAKTILESMNGTLVIKSDIKTGTYLMFELPDYHEKDENI